jgi:hypothetical protein
LPLPALTTFRRRLMIATLAEVSPFREIIRPLLLEIRLPIFTSASGDVLFNGIFDFDFADLFVERR